MTSQSGYTTAIVPMIRQIRYVTWHWRCHGNDRCPRQVYRFVTCIYRQLCLSVVSKCTSCRTLFNDSTSLNEGRDDTSSPHAVNFTSGPWNDSRVNLTLTLNFTIFLCWAKSPAPNRRTDVTSTVLDKLNIIRYNTVNKQMEDKTRVTKPIENYVWHDAVKLPD